MVTALIPFPAVNKYPSYLFITTTNVIYKVLKTFPQKPCKEYPSKDTSQTKEHKTKIVNTANN